MAAEVCQSTSFTVTMDMQTLSYTEEAVEEQNYGILCMCSGMRIVRL